MPSYAIVEFKGSKPRKEVACLSWLKIEEKQIYWPNVATKDQLKKYLIRKAVPNSTWKLCDIKKISHLAETYMEAKREMEHDDDTSDSISDIETTSRKRRKIKPKRQLSESTDDENQTKDLVKNNKFHKKLTNKKTAKDINNKAVNANVSLIKETEEKCPCISHIKKRNTDQKKGRVSKSASPSISSEEPDDSYKIDLSALVSLLIQKEEKIIQLLKENNRLLKSLTATSSPEKEAVAKINHSFKSNEKVVPKLNLPFESVEDIDENEIWLQKEENRTYLENFLSFCKGASASETTRNIMKQLFTKEVAKQMNWAGRGAKNAFSKLRLKNVVIHAVLKTDTVTITAVEEYIKVWLKNQNRF